MEGFIHIISNGGQKRLSMINPSINDYLDGRLESSNLERAELIKASFTIQQKKRLMTENEFENFMHTIITEHQTDKYEFSDSNQKNAFISYYIGKYKIYDKLYEENIKNYLYNHDDLFAYKNERIPCERIFSLILNKDMFDYYCLEETLSDHIDLFALLNNLDLEPLVKTINIIDPLFDGKNRHTFVETASSQLSRKISDYCADLDAEFYDVDIDIEGAVSRAICVEEHTDYIDTEDAVSNIEDMVINAAMREIDSLLFTLPSDILYYEDYTGDLNFYVYGADSLLDYYLDEKTDYSDNLFEKHNDNNSDSEINYIFKNYEN